MTTTTQTVLSASSFVDSIGVNTHTAYSWGAYNNASLVIDDLRYLGVTTVRDAFSTDPSAAPVMNALAAAGIEFDFVVSSDLPASGSAGLTQYVATVDAFMAEHPGSVVAMEGLNEANIQPFSYNGSSSLSAAAQFQAAFYTAIRGDADFNGVSVYNMTLGYNDAAAYASLGNLAKYADYSNAHAYVATSTPDNYGLDVSLDTASTGAVGKPSVITETGYTTLTSADDLGVDQTVQAKSILNLLVDSFKDGVSMTYLYELLDHPATTNAEASFGLFNADGTPKLAATAIHNLTTILADDGTGGDQPTAALDYTLGNLPSTGNSMVLAKSNGAYDLVVWAEPTLWNDSTDSEISNPTRSVTVHLGSVHHSVAIYDPLSGTTPIAVYSNVQDFTIPVSDHPLVVEIDAPSTVPEAPLPVTEVTGTAADIVSQLSDLNADGTVHSITLTDTHVLTVASEATMNYIIAHYGSVLSTINGGYSFAVTVDASAWKLTTNYDSTGKETSTDETAYVNGVIAYELVTNADGSTASTNYSGGVKTQTIVNYADKSQDKYIYGITGKSYVTEIDHLNPSGKLTSVTRIAADGTTTVDQYNSSGALTSETVTHSDGSTSTAVYAGSAKTQLFVTNANQTHDNYLYGIQGQTYTSQVQHVDASGNVTSVTRTHANGTLDYTETTASDGTITSTQYNSSGVAIAEAVVHTDGKKDIYALNIKGQSYTTQHSGFDAAGNLVLFEQLHADGSEALRVTHVNGTTTTDQFSSTGVLTSETIANADGSSSSSIYSGGVETRKYVTNADHSHDNYAFGITGQSYTTQVQHIDATGQVTSVTRTHADGTLDYTQVTGADGTRTGLQYDATGKTVMAESIVHKDGSYDIYAFNITGQAYATEHSSYNASGSMTEFERLRADGSELMKVTKSPDGSSVNEQFDTSGNVTREIDTHANGAMDVFNFNFGSPGTTQHVTYGTSGNVLQTDLISANGTHQVTANTSGQTLTGGAGSDQFVFAAASTTMVFNQGNDKVSNFHAGAASNHDVIEIPRSLAVDYGHLQIEQVGQNTLVQINATDSILLNHVTATQVTHDNFLFV